VRRSTGATCRGHPRRRLPEALKCRHHANRRRLGTTRPWARAHARRLPPPERTSGRSSLVWCPAGRVPPSRKDLCPAQPIPREGQMSGRRPPASFMMALTAPTPTPCRGAGRGGGRRTRHRRRAHRRRQSQACSHCLSGAAEPQMFMCPSSPAGTTVQPEPSRRLGVSPRASGGAYCHRRGGGPKRSRPRVGGLEACNPRAGLVGPPGEEGPGALQDVSFPALDFFIMSLST
jgi:putative hemolysin